MITLERVYKAYGDKQVLRDVNLSFPPGKSPR